MERLGGSCSCNDAWSNWNCTTDGTQTWRCADGKVEKQECVGGCNVMPVGTPDECVAVAPEGGGSAGGSASGSAGAAGNAGNGGSGGSATEPASGSSGAASGGMTPGGSAGAGSVQVMPDTGVAVSSAQTDSGCACVVAGSPNRNAANGGAIALLLVLSLGRRARSAASRRA